jgi:hypothetical protein
MGLDMYLTGIPVDAVRDVDGRFEGVELGYWRKHPDLHGFIVRTFADGVDECQEIELSADALTCILRAVIDESLPKTSGFFFGESQGANDQETDDQLLKAIDWLSKEKGRKVVYQASW